MKANFSKGSLMELGLFSGKMVHHTLASGQWRKNTEQVPEFDYFENFVKQSTVLNNHILVSLHDSV